MFRHHRVTAPASLIPDRKDWRGQFIIGAAQAAPEHFTTIRLSGISVHLHEGCTFLRLRCRADTAGLIIGTAIDYAQETVVQTDLDITSYGQLTPAAFEAAFERYIYSFAGTFICVISYRGLNRVYLDANGTKSLVYMPDRKLAASTTGLLLNDRDYSDRFDRDLYRRLQVRRDGWFPSGLTGHRGVHRLLCNHYLDLDRWMPVRHWPKGELSRTEDVRGHAVAIASIVERVARAVLSSGPAVCALTAGHETRFLLAACRSLADKLDFATVDAPARQIDTVRARQIARRFGLAHAVLPYRRATTEQAVHWSYMAGHCIGGDNLYLHPSVAPLGRYDFFLGGLGGEIGRGFFWRRRDDTDKELLAADLAARFGMPLHSTVVATTEDWLEDTRSLSRLLRLDLAYLELRMSARAFAQAYASYQPVVEVHPMICREAYQLMLELPPSAKLTNAFINEGVGALWPELLELPINRYGDYRDLLATCRKYTDLGRVSRKLRKMYGQRFARPSIARRHRNGWDL